MRVVGQKTRLLALLVLIIGCVGCDQVAKAVARSHRGNLVDRLTQHGHVTDFLNVGVAGLRTGIFNLADFVLLLGLALSIYDGMTDRN